ncbi:adenosylmethionine-8-amino-7-oxononanoate aminotransferase [Microbispora rosea]|uniref:Adenosylmethionine-8-amino-7-oxononanoate aminotransferase n=1 Tax=Microbispora rosea TaxID=58117 RepID=A0A1N7G1E7_9ACTN|nr:adenosylmethionine--8-amino-7-oxononanoate transaminase [Microbispora rosea]GIH51209.1 adenosylmethionine--8-amino-7-oxononanoate aminotransferase BioA [Microbispora rosea subsp. rosea]SIS06381.1 adenosylmethionine-8-amino-7-oxononanoate aminotransferase [Microbispora rosea]
MDAGEVLRLDREHVWHPYTAVPSGTPVHVVRRAGGVRITLGDGRELIDGMASWWAAIHGHNHPRLNRAARDQIDDMAHVMFGGLTHEPAVRLAHRLAGMTGLDRVFLADSGSVAVEVAIKMAVQYSGRSALLTVRGGYHGDTFGAMSVCDPVNGMHHLFTGMLPRHVFAPAPPDDYGRRPAAKSEAGPDEAYLAELTAAVEVHAARLAAIIVEPVVQGAGGMRFYHPAYLRRLRELADEHGILLIADEIATGFGRTGEMFGCDHAGIRPDIMCVGKALTGGYLTLAATLCTARVADRIGVLMHGPTYMGNPLACAVAGASLDLLAERPWREEVARIEAALLDGLAPAAAAPGVRDVRVLGAIGVIETDQPVDVAKIQDIVMGHGVWLRPFGRLIYTMPPYACTPDDVARIADAMVAATAAL